MAAVSIPSNLVLSASVKLFCVSPPSPTDNLLVRFVYEISILAEPSKDVPAIVLALANVVAVEAAIPRASISDLVWSAVAPDSIPSSLVWSASVKALVSLLLS